MEPLLVGLVIVDEMQGGRRMRQLADGWMGWEWRRGRRLRALGARLLLAVAARVAPANLPTPSGDPSMQEAAAR